MVSLIPNAKQQFVDATGIPLAGGFVYFYIPGTNLQKATYQDEALTIPNSNPVQLDGGGYAIIWGSGIYRQVVTDSNGTLIWDQVTSSDDLSTSSNQGTGTPSPIPFIPKAGAADMITIGGQAVVLVTGPCNGGYITNPPTATSQGIGTAENAYIDPVAAPGSTDAAGNGTTTILYPGQNFTVPPLAIGVEIWANAATSGHQFTVVTY